MSTSIKNILVFGRGQLGQEFHDIKSNEFNIRVLDYTEADITKPEEVKRAVDEYAPDCIINAAAFTQVDLAESEPEKAFQVNALGPYYLALAAKHTGALFIHISTDYVFDGKKEFFIESDTPNPLNVYGASKLSGEVLIKIADPKYYILRTSAMFGQFVGVGRVNFVDRMISMAHEGKTPSVVNDQFTAPTYAFDLAAKAVEFIVKAPPYGIYHTAGRGACSWFEFTQAIMETMNLNTIVNPIATDESASKIKRPTHSVLRDTLLEKNGMTPMPDWRDALARYCKVKYQI